MSGMEDLVLRTLYRPTREVGAARASLTLADAVRRETRNDRSVHDPARPQTT
jgi:hypothetical protein